jgi:pyruvate dehydrogenase E2 component (dihydrolipoamide acetyltransferase)
MSVTVSMPQLGESVTEGTVTRWLKKEGERVEADEPLLEVSTDKVDTEIPSPVSGVLRGITVAEDETVAVGAQLAIIDESGDGAGTAPAAAAEPVAQAAPPAPQPGAPAPGSYPYAGAEPAPQAPEYGQPAPAAPLGGAAGSRPAEYPPAAAPQPEYAPAPAADAPPGGEAGSRQAEYPPPYGQPAEPGYQQAAPVPGYTPPPSAEFTAPPQQAAPVQAPPVQPPPVQAAAVPVPPQVAEAALAPPPAPVAPAPPPAPPAAPVVTAAPPAAAPPAAAPAAAPAEGPYITPLVRKLAAEHGVDLAAVAGTGVGGRIRKQDVLEAARSLREQQPSQGQPSATPEPAAVDGRPAAVAPAPAPAQARPAPDAPPREIVPSSLRGTTERLSRARQLIARRMVESLQISAQLTTVVEADVTAITRLRERAKADFEAREGVRLSYLPFFALATLEALKVHPKLNAVLNTEAGQIIYHDAEHLGVAVDTERGLMVPVIRNAGDLNIGGLARKIADLASRTRSGQVSPDELAGGTFTITNTGSRGALFDTPIINQPQVAILGTGTVVKRPVVMEDPALGEVITVRSMVYLALTYDHRLIDGADAARFLTTVKDRLEEGAFEAELGL